MIRTFFGRLRRAYSEFAVVNPARHGAALAYFGMFALIPILAIGYQLGQRLLSEPALMVMVQFRSQLLIVLGEAVVTAFEEQVAEAAIQPRSGSAVLTVVSILIILYTGSGAFAQLKYSLNTVWGVPHETQLRPRRMILTRLLGMALVIGVGFLLVIAVGVYLVVSTVSSRLGLGSLIPILNSLVAAVLIAFSFGVLYRILPDARCTWQGAAQGAAVAAAVAMVGLGVVALYFRFVRLNTALSVAGGVAVLLIGINYFAQIFLFGAVLARIRTLADG